MLPTLWRADPKPRGNAHEDLGARWVIFTQLRHADVLAGEHDKQTHVGMMIRCLRSTTCWQHYVMGWRHNINKHAQTLWRVDREPTMGDAMMHDRQSITRRQYGMLVKGCKIHMHADNMARPPTQSTLWRGSRQPQKHTIWRTE